MYHRYISSEEALPGTKLTEFGFGASLNVSSIRYNTNMLILKDSWQSVPIMSLQTGLQIAETGELIIDPRQLKIIAFYCNGPQINFQPAVLYIDDIREIGSMGMIVDSADNIMSPKGLVRLQEVLDYGFDLIGKHVIEDNGNKLGRVSDYCIDNKSYFIVKIHVQPAMFKMWGTAELVIDRSQIIEINDKAIVVRSATAKEEKGVKMPVSLAVDNPFRRAQAENSTIESSK
jgi:uncharacterized protein YrrD